MPAIFWALFTRPMFTVTAHVHRLIFSLGVGDSSLITGDNLKWLEKKPSSRPFRPSVGHSIVVLALHSASDLLKEGDRMKLSPFPFPFFGRFVNQSKSKQGKCFDNENRFNPLTVRPCPLGSLRSDLANSRIRSHDAIHLQNIK